MTKKRILIAEDEAIIGMHLKTSLAGLGYEVVGMVKNAGEAVRECGGTLPDLILMDILMPGDMDGIDAARVIMNTYDIPVVYLTGNADMATVTRARETNPYGYVIKPINVQDLFSTIDTALHRRGLEMRLRESEEKYRRIAENMGDLISWIDRDDKITYVSPSHQKILGFKPEDLYRMNIFDLPHPDDKHMVMNAYRYFMDKTPFIRGEFRCRNAEGNYVWMDSTTTYIFTADGQFDGAVFSSRDITERKNAEAAIKESEERYLSLFNRSNDCIYVHDFTGNFLDANNAALNLMGYTKDEIRNVNFQSILSPDQLPVAIALVSEIINTGIQKEKIEFRLTIKGGGIRYIEALGSMIYRDGKPFAIQGIARDITDRRVYDDALRKSEAQHRLITGMMSDVVWTTDADFKVTYMSPSVEKVTGFTVEEHMSHQINDIITPESLARVMEQFAEEMRKDALGGTDPGRAVTIDCEHYHRDGSTVIMENTVRAIRDGDGLLIGLHGVSHDITERWQMEEQVRRSLREKETLLREVHHRVKNNFQVILSLLNLQSANIENRDLHKYFAEAQNRIRSMALVHELLYQSGDISRLDISRYLTTIVNELHSSYHHAVPACEPRIEAGRIELNIDQAIPCGLIINELLTNALKHAFPPGWEGKPDILISVSEKDGMIELVVSDNGIGLPESVDMKKTQTLGLSLTPMLAKQLFGTFEADRSKGTRFTVRFPRK